MSFVRGVTSDTGERLECLMEWLPNPLSCRRFAMPVYVLRKLRVDSAPYRRHGRINSDIIPGADLIVLLERPFQSACVSSD